jgi:hypothetical protein
MYILYTDGSGANDRIGGFAFVWYDSNTPRVVRRGFGGNTNVTAYEAEMWALREGLVFMSRNLSYFPRLKEGDIAIWKTDCQALIEWLRNPHNPTYDADGVYINEVLKSSELMPAIEPVWTPRGTDDVHFQWCDQQASAMREHMKQWLEATKK